MKTNHKIHFANSNSLDEIDDESVDLVVTSPPYPMIEMWDKIFGEMNEEIEEELSEENGFEAFNLMHKELEKTWEEVERVMKPGGMVCINIGDATRSIGGDFRLYPNNVMITQKMIELGFNPLPDIIWRKPTNSMNKFLGSGCLPTNQYVTLEHEYILNFRKGSKREFTDDRRYESAYFYEERNKWFSDVWTDVTGARQTVSKADRDRSGAYPIEIPYRLIQMYSVYEDTVLDPFWGTGTTTIAAMMSGRNSIGYEIDESFNEAFQSQIDNVESEAIEKLRSRVESHVKNSPDDSKYDSENYNISVKTAGETDIKFYLPTSVVDNEKSFTVKYEAVNSIENLIS